MVEVRQAKLRQLFLRGVEMKLLNSDTKVICVSGVVKYRRLGGLVWHEFNHSVVYFLNTHTVALLPKDYIC